METDEPRSLLRRIAGVALWSLIGLVVAFLTLLAAMILKYSNFPWEWGRTALAVLFVVAVIAAFVILKPRWKALLVFIGLFALVYLWFSLIPASHDRPWLPDVAGMPRAEFDGDLVTIHNVRNFSYRGADDHEPSWETRTFDLSQLETLDVYFSFWGPTAIAHTMLSFGFADGEHLALSVETRKEVGEVYSPLRSFFKQFELIYILADERDLVGLRTNQRLEDVYLFPTDHAPEQVRTVFLDVLATVNEIHETPHWYRTIKNNCTTSLTPHLDTVRREKPPFDIRLLLNGYIPQMAWERGEIPNDRPLDEIMATYAISEKARAAGISPGFSRVIREEIGIPVRTNRPRGDRSAKP